MSLIQKAAELNTTGVELLAYDQHYDEAIDVMTQSIKNMKSELIISSECHGGQPVENRSSAEIGIFDVGDSDEDIPFNRAIVISYRDNEHVIREDDIHLLSAAVIYNIALVHHHQVVHGSGKDHDLAFIAQKAEKLYMTVIKLLSGQVFSGRVCQVKSAVLIQLACCNNLAQLQFRSGSDESARHFLEMASGLFSIAKDADEDVFEDDLVQGLFLRAFLLRTRPQIAAAA